MTEAKHTPGPWIVRESVLNGKRYGGLWVEAVDQEDERGERLIQITGSGGAKSYTTRVVDIQIHDDNDANAHLIAAAPDLLSVARRILDRGYVSESIEEERADHQRLVSAIAKAGGRS